MTTCAELFEDDPEDDWWDEWCDMLDDDYEDFVEDAAEIEEENPTVINTNELLGMFNGIIIIDGNIMQIIPEAIDYQGIIETIVKECKVTYSMGAMMLLIADGATKEELKRLYEQWDEGIYNKIIDTFVDQKRIAAIVKLCEVKMMLAEMKSANPKSNRP